MIINCSVKTRIPMQTRSTNKFRRCPNCPHHTLQEAKCCCRSISTLRSKATTVRPNRDQSSMSTVAAEKNSSFLNTTIPTIMQENSVLKTENHHLKRELMNVSAFLKEDLQANSSVSYARQQKTISHQPSVSYSQLTLSQKLMHSNKALQEAIIRLENSTKTNQQLEERNCQLSAENEQLKVEGRVGLQEVQKYKRKCKKYYLQCEENKENVEVRGNRQNGASISSKEAEALVKKIIYLEQENQELREELDAHQHYQIERSSVHQRDHSISPEWIAHTNSKLIKMESNVLRIEEEIYQSPQELPSLQVKEQLKETINSISRELIHSNSFSRETVSVSSIPLVELIEKLVYGVVERIFSYSLLINKELQRKIAGHQRKIAQLSAKIENLVITLRNRQLRQKVARQDSWRHMSLGGGGVQTEMISRVY